MGSSTSKKGGSLKGSSNPQVGMASTKAPSTGSKGGKGNPCKPSKGY